MKKILVVDDDSDILDAITLMLEVNKYNALGMKDERGIYTQLEKEKPDLLLLDIWLSGANGLHICRSIKKNKNLSLPVILISASKEIQRNARLAGADDFLAKPFEMHELLEKIEANTTPSRD